MPYIPFTDEQKVLANSVNLEEFLRMRGEKLERVGREHKLIYYDSSGKHDSITLRGSTWFDHKNQVGGGAIKFMQEFYDITVAGVKRSLPVVPINENMSIAGFVIFGDTDVVEPCARALAEKLPPETEVLVTAEAKSIPLIYEMAKVMKMPRYVIARKSVKGYMRNPIITTVNSITNMGKEQILVVDEHDAEFIKGKKVAIIDDVISTGSSIEAIEKLVKESGGEVIARAAVLAEGDAADRTDIIYLEKIPLFFHNKK